MYNAYLFTTAVASRLQMAIPESTSSQQNLPQSLRPGQPAWTGNDIEQRADDWPARKSRWIRFIHSAMIANQEIKPWGAKAMSVKATGTHSEIDEDLLDHLDSGNPFELEIGGEG